MVSHKKTKNAMQFDKKTVRVISLAKRVRKPAFRLILGKSVRDHEIVELDFRRFSDTLRFHPFESGGKTFTIHTVKVEFWSNEPAREFLSGCEAILTEHLSSDEIITSAKLQKTFAKLGLDSEA